jgi:hypothetical protein
MKRFSEFVSDDLQENLLGKTYAFTQYRKHEKDKAKVVSLANRIQEKCKNGVQENDTNLKINHLLSAVFDLASAVKLQSDLASSVASIATASNLMAQNVRKEIDVALQKQRTKR